MKPQRISIFCVLVCSLLFGCAPDPPPTYIQEFNTTRSRQDNYMEIILLKSQELAQLWAAELDKQDEDDIDWVHDKKEALIDKKLVKVYAGRIRSLSAPPESMKEPYGKLVRQYELMREAAKLYDTPHAFPTLRQYMEERTRIKAEFDEIKMELDDSAPN